MNVMKALKKGELEGDAADVAKAAADAAAAETDAPGILDYPWYNYLNPQPGYGGWQETWLAERWEPLQTSNHACNCNQFKTESVFETESAPHSCT